MSEMTAFQTGKVLRNLNAGLYPRAVWPEDQAFYMTHSFTLQETVSYEALKEALDRTLRLYPYMTLAVVKRDRAYVLAENDLDFVIRETAERIEPSTPEGRFHALTICYEDRKLCFYVDHVLTDALGWRMVLQTFFYYYYCILDGVSYPVPEGVRTAADGVASDEQADAYDQVSPVMPRGLIAGMSEKRFFRCPEYPEGTDACQIEDCGHYVIQVPSEAFMAYAGSVGGSPNSVLIQILGQSLQKLHPENELPVAFWIPVSVRAAMGNRNSLLHQVVPTIWYADPGLLAEDANAPAINRQIRSHLTDFCVPDNIRQQCGMMHMIVESIRRSVTANRLFKFTQQTAGQEPYSVLASSLGRLVTGEYGSRIRMDAFRVMPGKTCHVYLMEIGGYFYISFSLGAKTDVYVRAAAEYMSGAGIQDVCWREVS